MNNFDDRPVPLIQSSSQVKVSNKQSSERVKVANKYFKKSSNEPLDVPSPNFISQVFFLLFLLMICVGLIRFSLGSEPIYFSTFLEGLTKVPTVTLNVFQDLTIVADWGLFNWFRDFVNILSGIVSLGVYLAGGMINILFFALYFVRFFFGF